MRAETPWAFLPKRVAAGAATEEASMEAEDMVCCDAGGAISARLKMTSMSRFPSHKRVTCLRKIFTTNSIIRDPPVLVAESSTGKQLASPFFYRAQFSPQS